MRDDTERIKPLQPAKAAEPSQAAALEPASAAVPLAELPAHAAGHQLVIGQVPPPSRRTDLGHDTLAIRHQHGLAAGGQADVLAELVLQNLQADGSHGTSAAPGSFLGERYAQIRLARADEAIE